MTAASSAPLRPAAAAKASKATVSQPAILVESAASVAIPYSANYKPFIIDPTDRLMNSQVLGEWNGTTLDGWTLTNAASSSISGGSLTVSSQSGTTTPVQISLQGLTGGPNLNYGYFDYLQVRLQLPVGFNKDVTFSFGTTVKTGFATDRTFTIPADQIVKDGGWHTYRLDLGLVVWWRDTLRDLRIQPLGTTGAGETMSIDYVEVGDLPGDTLLINTNLNYAPGVTSTTAQKLESKHFVVWWDPAVNPDGTAFNTATHGLRALRMMEESYQVYYKVLGYDDPFEHATISQRNGNHYKVNLTTWYGGFWMSSQGGFSYLNVGTSGLADEGWGNPVPHEYAHVTDGQQQGFLAGGHWESHANYMREARTNWFAPFFASDQQSTLDMGPLAWSNYHQDMKRLIYADYRIFLAIQDYAQSLGLDPSLGAQLWKSGSKDMSVYAKLATLLPTGVTVKDVVGTTMRYWPMLDFVQRDAMRRELWTNATERAEYDFRTGSYLVASPDNAGWYRVPFERAPEKFAYMFHSLTPTSNTITVNLRGLDLYTTDEDWRWCLAEVDASNNVRYSDVWAPGSHSFTLNSTSNKVLLIVVATPGGTALDLESFYNTKPTDRNTDRLRYPYEVQLAGAVPAYSSEQINITTTSGHTHTNGGGWVANTATVASTAYVGPHARVLGTAKVQNYARIEDYAVVSGSAQVLNYAEVSGYAWVKDNAVVKEYARVRDHAMVASGTTVKGNAIVEEFAYVYDTVVMDSAIIRGNAYPFGGFTVSGTAICDYDYSSGWNMSDGVHFGHFPWGGGGFGDYYDATLRKPRGLVASYRVEETAGEVMWDEFGAEQAWLRGSPTRADDTTMNSQVLQFNGTSQYALLDRSLADFTDGTYGLWLKPTTTTTGQTLLYFGSTANTYMKLVARDANGFARLTISVNGTVKELVSTVAIPVNQWTHLALSFGGGTAKFYVNGQAAGSLTTTYRPTDVLVANDYQSAEQLYLGRDATGNYFTGSLEDVRFYNVTLTQAEVANEKERGGARIGQFYATTPATFDGATTMAESGVHNGLTRTLAAWIKPNTSDTVSFYEPIVDSNFENDSSYEGTGIGLSGGKIKVRLDGVGMWSTNVPITLGAWQHVAVAFNGTSAKLYVNGVQKASRTYSVSASSLAGKNYRIGWGQSGSDASTRTYFDGQIYDLEIYDRMIVPAVSLGTPAAANDTATMLTNSSATTINVLANDTHPSPIGTLTVSTVTQGAHGTVAIASGSTAVSYTPAARFAGSDSFTYTVSDGFGGTATATVQVTVNSTVAGRRIFYNASGFDGQNATASAGDDGAIATDKSALLAGQLATFANYTSYSRGINGIMVDIANLANAGALSAADFVFKVSNDGSTWNTASAPASITVRAGAGVNGADRVTIIWPDNLIQNQWLQVTVKATANTGLGAADVFYFGNQIGETGNASGNTAVNALDVSAIANHYTGFVPAAVGSAWDINRDAAVNALDVSLVANHYTGFTSLALITPVL